MPERSDAPSAEPGIAIFVAPRRRAVLHRALREWALLVVLLCLLVLWQGPLVQRWTADPAGPGTWPDPTGQVRTASLIGRVDLAVYDLGLRVSALPPDPRVVVVAIDDTSVAQIGRWPWRRVVLAELVARVAAMGPRGIAIDVVFSEASSAVQEDLALAEAFEAARPVLAVAREPYGRDGYLPLYPDPAIAGQSPLAHVVLTHGSDGRVRGLFASEAFLPALSLALVDPSAAIDRRSAGDRRAADDMLARGDWVQSEPVLMRAFRSPPPALSAVSVLRGEVDPASIAGRYVLIGSTAVGIGDRFSTPLFSDRTQSSGVELHGLAAAALLEDHRVRPIDAGLQATGSVLAVIGLMMLLFRARPQRALPICAVAIGLVLLLTLLCLHQGLWIQPGGLLSAFVLAYPLWSWRRLSAASIGLLRQARHLENVPTLLGDPPAMRRTAEPIARELSRLSSAATQVRLLNQFLLDGMESLPHPVLIADPSGRILYRNRRMLEAFQDQPPPIHGNVAAWFASIFKSPLSTLHGEQLPEAGLEQVDARGRHWLASLNRTNRADSKGSAAAQADDRSAGERGQALAAVDPSDERWLLQLVDVSALRAAEREREEAISFLSHDLRSPQASILAMADSTSPGGAIDHSALRRHARRALALTDEFLAFARAGSKPIERLDYDLIDLVTEVVDLSWDRARAASVVLGQETSVAEALFACDSGMMRRALLNLVENAIRHSPAGGTVVVRLTDSATEWSLSVEDEGHGIPPAQLGSIFNAWWQVERPVGALPPGGSSGSVGLGLAMVRRTASRHGGMVIARNRVDRRGACLELRLPRAPASIIFDHAAPDRRTESHDRATGAA